MQIETHMTQELTSPERVLFNATFKFFIDNGFSEVEAKEKAINKINQKRSVGKKLNFKF
jgi:hypothetical protein